MRRVRTSTSHARRAHIGLAGSAIMVLVAGILGFSANPALAAPPANDNFADAQAHTTGFTDSVSNVDATVESGEPGNHCTPPEVKTVWYSFTPTSSGTVDVDTAASNFDTVLTAYTGSSLTALTEVTCNDDAVGLTSAISFTASASTTYWIRVGGFPGDTPTGNAVTHVAFTPAGADVSASVAESADPVSLGGDNVTYTVTVANAGGAGATGVSAATTLSGSAASIISATASQGSCSVSAATVTCALGAIAASGSATVTVTVAPTASGTVTATASVTADQTDPVPGNNADAESTTVDNALGCTIVGTNGNDTLNGGNGADVICGLGGKDTINGGNNNDIIYGGAGDDIIDGGNGDDIIHGGDGNDAIGGGNGADQLYGEAGDDTNRGETLLGSLLNLFDNGNDHIYGGPGNDDLDGQNGDDVLVDHDGTDTMSGSTGNDSIDVQDGVGGDTANGGLGTDTCTVDAGDTTTSC